MIAELEPCPEGLPRMDCQEAERSRSLYRYVKPQHSTAVAELRMCTRIRKHRSDDAHTRPLLWCRKERATQSHQFQLVFEQIIKRRAGIVRALTAFAGCFFLDHYTDGIKRAVIELVFGRDSGWNRLVAFKAAGWIEVFTLFAGVQSETALWALSDGIGEILEQRTTLRTTRHGSSSRHVKRTRSKGVFFPGCRRLLEFFLTAPTRILIAALSILRVRQ